MKYNVQPDPKNEIINNVDIDGTSNPPKTKGAYTPKGYYITLSRRHRDGRNNTVVYMVFSNKDDYTDFINDVGYYQQMYTAYPLWRALAARAHYATL